MAYSEEEINKTFNDICQGIESGLSLRTILLDEDMPSSRTFYKWIDSDESKVKQYARATTIRSEQIFDEILEIADSTGGDIIENADGKEYVNHEVINRDRLRVDSRKWVLSKMNPKKYSDKIQVDQTEFIEQPLFPDVQEDNSDK